MTQRILFTGSRETTPEMITALRRYLISLIGEDVHVIVGDAHGVDYEVVRF